MGCQLIKREMVCIFPLFLNLFTRDTGFLFYFIHFHHSPAFNCTAHLLTHPIHSLHMVLPSLPQKRRKMCKDVFEVIASPIRVLMLSHYKLYIYTHNIYVHIYI